MHLLDSGVATRWIHEAVLPEQRVDLVVGQRRVPHGEVRHLAMEVATGIELGKVFVARVAEGSIRAALS